jgi:hypothetical protein
MAAALCRDLDDARDLLNENMSAAKYCDPSMRYTGRPGSVSDPIFQMSLLGTSDNDLDFIAVVLAEFTTTNDHHVVIQSTNGVCGPWIWKTDLIDWGGNTTVR